MTEALRQTYDTIAEDWYNENKNDTWWHRPVEEFAAVLPPGGTVLDIGCGPGWKAKFLSDRGFVVTGVDISPKMIELAKVEDPASKFAVASMETLTMLEKFDGVMLFASLLHIPKKDAPAVVKRAASFLAPGGHLYVVVKQTRPGEPEEQTIAGDYHGKPYERFFSFYTVDELQKLFDEVGLTVVHTNTQPVGRAVWLHAMGRYTQRQ